MQRAVAWLLFVVFLLGPFAPAIAAAQPPQPMACLRMVEMGLAPSPGMEHCQGMGHNAHATTPTPAPAQTFTRGCCADHDCCRRHDRTQALHLSSAVKLLRVDAAIANLVLPAQPVRFAHPSNAHSGRAPPAL